MRKYLGLAVLGMALLTVLSAGCVSRDEGRKPTAVGPAPAWTPSPTWTPEPTWTPTPDAGNTVRPTARTEHGIGQGNANERWKFASSSSTHRITPNTATSC